MLALVVLAAGCGGGEDGRLVVAAAASLREPLTACSGDRVRLAFAGSDELAAQIRRGVRPDVFAAANTALPEALAEKGLLADPVEFATNELVLAVPGEGARVASLEDLERPGVELVTGAESVPVGAYARDVLARLPPARERAILANVRSAEPSVSGVVGKLVQGAADAGFVYATDVTDGLRAIRLPSELRPAVAYGAGVVVDGAAARDYVDGLATGACADALRAAGFGPAPER